MSSSGSINAVTKVFDHPTITQSTSLGRLVPTAVVSASGGPTVALRRPDVSTIKNTLGDGNSIFRELSYLITGTQGQYGGVHDVIVQYDDLLMCSTQVGVNLRYNSLSEYITKTAWLKTSNGLQKLN